jgi:7-cyano-7-deazaguanine synthase
MPREKAVAIVSGGMDSVTLAYMLKDGGNDLIMLSFDYGQRHVKEINFARKAASVLGAQHSIVPMQWLGQMLHGSALTDNSIEEAAFVATGVHAGDHAVYPDCRPGFISLMSQTMQIATEGFSKPTFTIEAPFVHMTKAEIVSLGENVRVPWEDTWSCYKGGVLHCGKCGTCVERREAFSLAGVVDPTTYDVA